MRTTKVRIVTKIIQIRKFSFLRLSTEVLAIAENTTDLLNWYEATQREQLSGTFERDFEMLDHPQPPPTSPVVDPIARTLDELEVEFATP
jgi:hypothetical protein